MFSNFYKNKKVLVTGHTGFKGSWLTTWLIKLGADVIGLSVDVPTEPAMFDVIGLSKHIKHIQADIRDLSTITNIINKERPDVIFHLAAQAIVSVSYDKPVETLSTNVIGTMNMLESMRIINYECIAIFITSDKCYDNVEWVWGYRENDPLGGKDVYSGSKAAAELVIKSYVHSFLNEQSKVKVGICRAGNVIGGGDWAKDRIVVDCVRSWSSGKTVTIRSPDATRPWQHVLEPISGYLRLGMALKENNKLNGEAFNFGPRAEQNMTVIQLLDDLRQFWGLSHPEDAYKITGDIPFHEAGLLKLNCDKALFYLQWEATLKYSEMIKFIGDWYVAYYSRDCDMFEKTVEQITEYEIKAKNHNRVWSVNE